MSHFFLFRNNSAINTSNYSIFVDVAEIVFNKCTTLGNDLAESHDFEVKLDYEFLEDIYANWPEVVDDDVSIASDMKPLFDHSESISGDDEQNEEFRAIGMMPDDDIYRDLERKRNHPLMLMVYHTMCTL